MTTLIEPETPESRFNRQYITSQEICEIMNITRGGLTKAIDRGTIPAPLYLNCWLSLWERDTITPLLEEWKQRQAKQFPNRV